MGYYAITNLINRKDNMTTSNETKKLINELKNVESLKVVNIALELNKLQDKTTEELINVVKTMDSNMKLLATKVLELEKRYERF
jgi:copper chaperone CopZ